MNHRLVPVRRLSGLAATWLVCAGLSACAALTQPSQPALVDAPAAAAKPAPGASAPIENASVAYRLDIQAPADLRKMLQTYLDLARFQNAPETEGITNAELIRLTNASPSQARQLLETEGYFNPHVTVTRSDPPGDTPLITLRVDPGTRATVTGFELQSNGELQKRAEAGDKDANALLERINKNWTLQPGEVFRQPAWSGAKNGALAQVRADGYPTATWSASQAQVDAQTNHVSLAATVESGPQFILGALEISGVKKYSEDAIRNLADFAPGTPYSEKRLLDFQERIGKLGLFESVVVEIDPDESKAKAVPVKVRVTEQKMQQAIAGVGFSDNTRERFTLEHRHRRPFGFNVQAHNKIELGRYQSFWEGDLLSDPTEDRYRKLVAGGVSRLETTTDVTRSWHVRAGRSLDTERIERLIFAEYLSATVSNLNASVPTKSSNAISGNYNWIWREVDSIILPTRGLTSTIQFAGGYARSRNEANATDPQANGPFVRVYTRNTLYWPLGNNWYSQARVEYGEVFAKLSIGIPEPLLFRAGGDDSVRGYEYKNLGPHDSNDVLFSGHRLLTGSVEVAHPFTSRQPAFLWAVFLDAGNAVEQWTDYKPALGYGVGLRWRSPVGPLRIDAAYGQDVHKARLHFSVGIAF